MSKLKIAVTINSIAIVALGVAVFMGANDNTSLSATSVNDNAAIVASDILPLEPNTIQMIKSHYNKVVSDTHIVASDTFPLGFNTIFNIKTNEMYTLLGYPTCNNKGATGEPGLCCTISKGAIIYHPRFNEPGYVGAKSMFTVKNNNASIPNACPESFLFEVNTALFDKYLEADIKAG